MSGFTAADIPDLAGRTAIVTGANSGIGLETAKALTHAGAHVVLAVRDEAKGRGAADTWPASGTKEVRHLDLASLDSVRAFARDSQATPSSARRASEARAAPRPPAPARRPRATPRWPAASGRSPRPSPA
jgi:NAD(P)-dependent dehydrogenase (short-subunit alcohol dehydrogenase family)